MKYKVTLPDGGMDRGWWRDGWKQQEESMISCVDPADSRLYSLLVVKHTYEDLNECNTPVPVTLKQTFNI